MAKCAKKPGRLDLRFCIASRFYRQELTVSDKAVLSVVFHDRLQVLASFHEEQTLVLSKLTLNAPKRRLDRRLIAELHVPIGFDLWDQCVAGSRVVLHKPWELEDSRGRRSKAELLFVDLTTLEQQRAVAVLGGLQESLVTGDRLLVRECEQYLTRLVPVELKFES